MRNIVLVLIILAIVIAYTAHYTHRNILDVSPRDVQTTAKAIAPTVDMKDGSVIIRPSK